MATWPITKQVTIGTNNITVSAVKNTLPDNSTSVTVTGTYGTVSHTEVWTLPHDNPNYSQEQAQYDFNVHIQKVATTTAGKYVANSVSDGLTAEDYVGSPPEPMIRTAVSPEALATLQARHAEFIKNNPVPKK